jgi:glucose-1-phosphate cytidylyltransferase
MKAVILAGGLGTRLAEETHLRPKPMVEIGGRPILWHIMKGYAQHGIGDFIICCGHRGYVIKEYFANYFLHACDVTFNLRENEIEVLEGEAEPWRVTVVDTGVTTQTGGRLRRIRRYLAPHEPFCLTYGDGVGDVDITAVIRHHRASGAKATVTAVQPPGRFGALELDATGRVRTFREKPLGDTGRINGGFFVCEPAVLDYIEGDETIWEHAPLERLAAEGALAAYQHTGFWQPMDTLRDRRLLEELWASGQAPWRTW